MDYHLKPISKTCAATGDLLDPGTNCHCVLVDQDGKLVRFDFSEQGWTGPPEGTIGYWRSVVPETDQRAKPTLNVDAMMRYFEQLCEDAIPVQDKLRYVLALWLVKKRRLKIQDSHQDGEAEILELMGSQEEGPFEVRDQQLSEVEIEKLQHELNAHLATEWS